MAKVIWTETALRDVEHIGEFISKDSKFYAKQFVKKIFHAVVVLETHPMVGTVVEELPKLKYREILLKKYSLLNS